MDAVKGLADAAGREVPAADPRAAEKAKKREESVSINERAARFYAKMLAPDQGAAREPRHYLSGRGISDAMIDRFGIGFAPGSKIGEPSPQIGRASCRERVCQYV